MAEVILSPLLDAIIGNLSSAALEELQRVWGVDNEIQNLRSTLSTIQAVLEDAEDRQLDCKPVQDWLHKLKGVAYDAEDLVDEIATEALQSKMESRNEVGKKRKRVWDYLPSFLNSRRRDMACRIRDINMQLDKVTKERRELHLEIRYGSKHFETREQRRTVSSVRDESEVIGRGNEREQIIKFLLSDDSKRKYSVIAVVGMGGLGKTTLAQVVYNDERVTTIFEVRAWVCVSEYFDVIRLTKEIIESASGRACDLSSIDALQRRLQEILSGKRFLLVLDDVWNEKPSYWEQLRAPFAFGAKESKIVVTTRSREVSNVMQPTVTYNLDGLSDEDCWALFASRAFVDNEDINAYPCLPEIGRKLVERCQGLPLSAKALGGLLSSTREAREWENVLKGATWELHGAAAEILPALRLSYQHLPAHLKRCFTFCSVYPKDHLFVEEDLVKRWIAHGFVHPKDGKQMEDTGSRYFNDLVLRSFFQYSATFGKFTMHDLFHDLAQSISGSECFHKDHFELHGIPKKARHLSMKLIGGEERANFEALYELKGLRTLLLQNFKFTINKVPEEMLSRLRFIRVLELTGYDMPDSIGDLRHLRYLKLKNHSIKELPESICSIYNLQTLILSYCHELVKLPDATSKLINLRHLKLDDCFRLLSTPPGIGRLNCLQTLPLFVVGRERGTGIAELKELADLRGDLEIRNLENVEAAVAACQANLKSKLFINKLTLQWSSGSDRSSQDEKLEEDIAEELQPHPNLKELIFRGYMGTRFPSWMMEVGTDMLLSKLTTVGLEQCRKCSILPPLGQLPSLVDLSIIRMDEMKHTGEGHLLCLKRLRIHDCRQLISLPRFPSLEELDLQGLDNLEDWCSVGKAHFRNLRKLSISRCPKMTEWPSKVSALAEPSVSQSHQCWAFDAFPLFPSLRELTLGESSERLLNSMSGLTSLSLLTIHFLKLTAMPRGVLQSLTQLKELNILFCDKLETLLEEDGPKDGGIPSTLTHLTFFCCSNLKSIPRGLHALTSLHSLSIRNCPRVTYLPEEGLPAGLQCLSIQKCPRLVERCCKDTGDDWPKISHIRNLWLH